MAKIKFESDEHQIMELIPRRIDNYYAQNFKKAHVILTNQRILWMDEALFGGYKSIIKQNLRDIKYYDEERPYVTICSVLDPRGYEVKIRFAEDTLVFVVESEQDANIFIGNVNSLLTGSDKERIIKEKMSGYDVLEKVGSVLKGGIDSFKKGFGLTKEAKDISVNCPHCGGVINGKENTNVVCKFCGSTITIKK